MPNATLLQRLARIAPYFRASRAGFAVALLAAAIAAMTEPMLPALLKRLLDEGFGPSRSFPLWIVPVIIVGLYVVRGLATFVAQYALAWAANLGVLNLPPIPILDGGQAAIFSLEASFQVDEAGMSHAHAMPEVIAGDAQGARGL